MGNSTEDMELELEQKDKKSEFLENKRALPDSKVIEKMNRLGLKKVSSNRKGFGIMDRLNISLKNYKYIENKITKTKIFTLIMTCYRNNFLIITN